MITLHDSGRSAWLTWVGVGAPVLLLLWSLYNIVPREDFGSVVLGLGGGAVILGLIAYGFHRLLRAVGIIGQAQSDQPETALRIDGERIEVMIPSTMPESQNRILKAVMPRAVEADESPKWLSIADIEQIRVDRHSSFSAKPDGFSDQPGYYTSNSHVLLIDADEGQLVIQGNGERKCLEWLRRYLEYRIVNGVEAHA